MNSPSENYSLVTEVILEGYIGLIKMELSKSIVCY